MHCTHQLYKQIWAHPCPMDTLYGNYKKGNHIYGDTFYGNWRRGNHIWNQKNKYNKPNVRINIINEGYFYTMKILQLY